MKYTGGNQTHSGRVASLESALPIQGYACGQVLPLCDSQNTTDREMSKLKTERTKLSDKFKQSQSSNDARDCADKNSHPRVRRGQRLPRAMRAK